MATTSSSIFAKPVKDRYSCVLDPTLAFSEHGLPLVKCLGEIIDVWIAREFWYVLDNIHFYTQHPELLIARKSTEKKEEIIRVLKQWKYVCDHTDLLGVRLFWVKDKLRESLLPNGTNPSIIQQFEFFACLLNEQINQHFTEAGETLRSSFRDTLALSAALGSTFILTHQSPRDAAENSPPAICLALENWGIACKAIERLDEMAVVERNCLRHIIVQAGLSKHIWAGLKLSVVHLLVPLLGDDWSLPQSQESSIAEMKGIIQSPTSVKNLWKEVQGFWYQL
jgi:hypothetical protein